MWSACVEPVLGGSPRVGTHDCRPCVSDSACPSHLLGPFMVQSPLEVEGLFAMTASGPLTVTQILWGSPLLCC